MARFLLVLLAAAVVVVQAGGQLGHAAPATAEVFWRTVLPRSPLPEAILRLLRPAAAAAAAAADTSFVNKAEDRPPFDYQDYKRPSSDDDSSKRSGAPAGAGDFDYDDYRGAEKPRVATAVAGRTVLPRSPMPDAILRLLRPAAAPDTSFVSRDEDRPPFDYQDYKRSSSDDDSSERTGASNRAEDLNYDDYSVAKKPRVAAAADTPFGYDYRGSEKPRIAAADTPFGYDYKAPAINQAGERAVGTAADTPFGYDYKAPTTNQAGERLVGAAAADTPFGYDYKATSTNQEEKLAPFGYDYKAPSTATGGGKAEPKKTTVFFHEEAVRVGERLPFHFPPALPAALGFLPRRIADSVPFTTPALPGVLAAFGVSPNSAMAAGMEATLRACDTPTTIPGESKFCATSLEVLVERAMGVLGTRDVTPVTSTLPRASAPLQTYTVRAVRPVEGGPVFVACHDEPYPYTVYRCHTTGPSRAYMVEMEGAAVSIATVCHTDTSMWNPEHVSFKLLGTKPGGTPVCHLMPYGHIIWAKKVKRATA